MYGRVNPHPIYTLKNILHASVHETIDNLFRSVACGDESRDRNNVRVLLGSQHGKDIDPIKVIPRSDRRAPCSQPGLGLMHLGGAKRAPGLAKESTSVAR